MLNTDDWFTIESGGGAEGHPMSEKIIWIPNNVYGIEEGRYEFNEVVNLLRTNQHQPGTIRFIADMLEE